VAPPFRSPPRPLPGSSRRSPFPRSSGAAGSRRPMPLRPAPPGTARSRRPRR
jgi:hypothetical protein